MLLIDFLIYTYSPREGTETYTISNTKVNLFIKYNPIYLARGRKLNDLACNISVLLLDINLYTSGGDGNFHFLVAFVCASIRYKPIHLERGRKPFIISTFIIILTDINLYTSREDGNILLRIPNAHHQKKIKVYSPCEETEPLHYRRPSQCCWRRV